MVNDKTATWKQLQKFSLKKQEFVRPGRTICGPQCVPKSTSVTLAVDEKTLPMATITGRMDRQTDRQSVTQYAAPPREEGHIKMWENASTKKNITVKNLSNYKMLLCTNQAACFWMKCQLWHKCAVAARVSFVLCTAQPLPPYKSAVVCRDWRPHKTILSTSENVH